MSPLPERRKSAEELAELRKSLGVPASSEALQSDDRSDAPRTPPPAARRRAEKPVDPEVLKSAVFEAADPPRRVEPRPVRTFKKSERDPRAAAPVRAANDGRIPVRRHSERELMALRQATAPPDPGLAVKHRGAGWPLLLPAYALGLVAVIAGFWMSTQYRFGPAFPFPGAAALKPEVGPLAPAMVAAAVAWLLAWAGWIALRRPLSRHHAGFLTLLAMLVLIFATLYFYPALHGA